MLDSVFLWHVDPTKPELGYCPVVVMGHSLKDDFNMLSRTLGVRPAVFETVVKTIDTQHLCRETGYWPSRSQAGLSTLVSACNFQYRDAHTASNDAAMTLICAVQMVLPPHLKSKVTYDTPDISSRSLQDVIDDIEVASQYQDWAWGTDKYCIRCGERGHTRGAYNDMGGRKKPRPCFTKIRCVHCAGSKDEKRVKAAGSHVAKNCIAHALRGPEVEFEEVTAGIRGMGIDY